MTVVQFHLDAQGEILDCDVNKRNQLMVDMIEMEVGQMDLELVH